LPLLLAIVIDEGVGEDAVEPSLEVGALGKLVERGESFDVRLLHEVFGIGRIPSHPHRRRVELIEERQGVALETRSSLFDRFLWHRALLSSGSRSASLWPGYGRRIEPDGRDGGRLLRPCPPQG